MLVLHENRELPSVAFMRMSGKPTDEEIEIYLIEERARARTVRNLRTVIVMELDEVWSSTQRKRVRDFEAEMEAQGMNQTLGLAVAVPNSLIRGAFTAFFWISAPQYPTKMVPRSVDAWPWVSERLRGAGLSAPSRADFERVATSVWTARQAIPGRGMVLLNPGAGRRAI